MIEKFRKRLENYTPIPDALWYEILESVKVMDVPRQEIFIRHDTCYRNLYYILDGSFKSSLILEDGTSKAVWFHFADHFDFVCSVEAFFLNEPSRNEIAALSDSKVLSMKKSQYDDWIERYPEFAKAFLNIVQEELLKIIGIYKYMMSHSAADIFKFIQERYPHFIERLPSYLVAEFMGITPEWYSKLLKKQELPS